MVSAAGRGPLTSFGELSFGFLDKLREKADQESSCVRPCPGRNYGNGQRFDGKSGQKVKPLWPSLAQTQAHLRIRAS